jgi:hypothetical protein
LGDDVGEGAEEGGLGCDPYDGGGCAGRHGCGFDGWMDGLCTVNRKEDSRGRLGI